MKIKGYFVVFFSCGILISNFYHKEWRLDTVKRKEIVLELFYTKQIISGHILVMGNWVVGTGERGNGTKKVKPAALPARTIAFCQFCSQP